MRKSKAPTSVTTAILTLITIIFWAGFEIYHSITTKPVPPVSAEIINPIDPTLDTKTLDSLLGRTFLIDNDIKNVEINSQTPTPTPSPVETVSPFATESPLSTGSASPSPTPTSTP